MVFGINRFSDRKDIIIFIIGLLSLVKVRLLGTFGMSELLIFGLYFFTVNPFLWLKNRVVTKLFLATLLWTIGVFFSDRYNGVELVNSLKGFFNVFFLLLLIPFVYWALYDKPHRMLYFWTGNAISSLIAFYIQKSASMDEIGFEVWRTYAWYYPFIVLSGIFYYKGKILLSCIVIEGFAIWSLFNLSRNIFLTVTISICVILFIHRISKFDTVLKIIIYKQQSIKLLSILLIALLGISSTYEYLASNRILGERAYSKYYMQKHSKLGLASGRNDFIQSIYLISKKPIMGYGSYAKDNYRQLEDYYRANGLTYNTVKLRDKMLPGHSYLMGGWVYSGILGFIFWIYIIIQIIKYIREGILYDSRLVGINTLLTFAILWNIFFSPFADRLNFLFYITMVVLTLNSREKYA